MARRINLVPVSERARTTTNVAMLGLVAATIIVVFGLGLGYYMFQSTLDDRKDELASLEQETQLLQAQVAALRKYEILATDRQRAEATVQEIYAGRTLVSDFLNSLSLVMPENVWLSSLALSTADPTGDPAAPGAGTFSMSGKTYSFEDVAQLLVRLQLVPAIEGIKLGSAGSSSGDAGTDVKDFSITATLKAPSEEVFLPVSQVEVGGL